MQGDRSTLLALAVPAPTPSEFRVYCTYEQVFGSEGVASQVTRSLWPKCRKLFNGSWEDLHQEVLLALLEWVRDKGFDSESAFPEEEALQVARRAVRLAVRGNRRECEPALEGEDGSIYRISDLLVLNENPRLCEAIHLLQGREGSHRINWEAKLTDTEFQVFKLRVLHGHGFEEIGYHLNLPGDLVKKTVRRLRRKFAKLGPDGKLIGEFL